MSTLYDPKSGYWRERVYSGLHKPCGDTDSAIPISATNSIIGCFCEYKCTMQISSAETYSASFPTQHAREITVFAKNTGETPVVVRLQHSPNGLDYMDDPQQLELSADQTGYLVPYIFSKFTRVAASCAESGSVQIWFQMQNNMYCLYRQ